MNAFTGTLWEAMRNGYEWRFWRHGDDGYIRVGRPGSDSCSTGAIPWRPLLMPKYVLDVVGGLVGAAVRQDRTAFGILPAPDGKVGVLLPTLLNSMQRGYTVSMWQDVPNRQQHIRVVRPVVDGRTQEASMQWDIRDVRAVATGEEDGLYWLLAEVVCRLEMAAGDLDKP